MKVGKYTALLYIGLFAFVGGRVGELSELFLTNQLMYIFFCSISGFLTLIAIILLIKIYKKANVYIKEWE